MFVQLSYFKVVKVFSFIDLNYLKKNFFWGIKDNFTTLTPLMKETFKKIYLEVKS